jgi:hypothetical protein
VINQEILSLQREILLNKLMGIDKQIGSASLRPKKVIPPCLSTGNFYVRYLDAETGKYIPIKRSLDTADREEAEKRAVKNADYYRKKSGIKDIYELFSNFYKPDKSIYLQDQIKRGDRSLAL